MSGVRRVGPRGLLAVFVAAVLTVSTAEVLGESPVSHSTTWRDSSGTHRAVSFQGTVDGANVAGTLRVAGQRDVYINATISSRGASITGTIQSESGLPLGTFSGQRDPDGMVRGTATVGSAPQIWEVPATALPVDAAP
jgi:hypothetical protein